MHNIRAYVLLCTKRNTTVWCKFTCWNDGEWCSQNDTDVQTHGNGEVELCFLAAMSRQPPCWELHQPSTPPMNPACSQATHTNRPIYNIPSALWCCMMNDEQTGLPSHHSVLHWRPLLTDFLTLTTNVTFWFCNVLLKRWVLADLNRVERSQSRAIPKSLSLGLAGPTLEMQAGKTTAKSSSSCWVHA